MPDFAETTGSCGGSPEIAQKNIVDVQGSPNGSFVCKLDLFDFGSKGNTLFLPVGFQSLSPLIMSEKQQRLVYSIIEFLNQSIDDGTVKADDKESLEVASA